MNTKELIEKMNFAEQLAIKEGHYYVKLLPQDAQKASTLITSIQSQNDRLVSALEKVSASWQRHGPRIIESRGGLGDNRVCEVNDAIEAAQALLTEIKKGH